MTQRLRYDQATHSPIYQPDYNTTYIVPDGGFLNQSARLILVSPERAQIAGTGRIVLADSPGDQFEFGSPDLQSVVAPTFSIAPDRYAVLYKRIGLVGNSRATLIGNGQLQLFDFAPQPGLLAFASGKLATLTINATTVYTTGGITLPGQIAAPGSIWRLRAYGVFTPVSSATARNWQIAPFWGTTQLTASFAVVPASSATVFSFLFDCLLIGTSSTAITTSAVCIPGVVASPSGGAAPTSTVVAAGPQTIDLRFSMSVAVATDSWGIYAVTIERVA
jgi:hypothetical protein